MFKFIAAAMVAATFFVGCGGESAEPNIQQEVTDRWNEVPQDVKATLCLTHLFAPSKAEFIELFESGRSIPEGYSEAMYELLEEKC